jgi:hypothetical protein
MSQRPRFVIVFGSLDLPAQGDDEAEKKRKKAAIRKTIGEESLSQWKFVRILNLTTTYYIINPWKDFSDKYKLDVGPIEIPENKTLLMGPPAGLDGTMELGAWYLTNKSFRVGEDAWHSGPALVILPRTGYPFSSVQVTVYDPERENEVKMATAMIISNPASR